MTKDAFEKAFYALKREVKGSVVSFFSPVVAVVQDFSRSVEVSRDKRLAGGDRPLVPE